MVELSDQEFIENLRAAVVRYLAGVDRWEAAYQKYYRMPGWVERVSADLEPERLAATDCLVRLAEECRVWEPEIPGSEAKTVSEPQTGKQSLLKRLVDYFY